MYRDNIEVKSLCDKECKARKGIKGGCGKLDKIRAAVIGATGIVGQRFIQLLEGHPWFELSVLAASGKSQAMRAWGH